MVNVMAVVKSTKQPRGGYINWKTMDLEYIDDGITLNEEDISPITMGLVVDYLTRWRVTGDIEDAFHVSISGSRRFGHEDDGRRLLSGIRDMSDASIVNACRLVAYDTCARAAVMPPDEALTVTPSKGTMDNIRTMVDRGLRFFDRFGPVVSSGFNLLGGYSGKIDRGDFDYATMDTLWDFKVSKRDPDKDDTLQLLIYYLMGRRSIHPFFGTIHRIGIFNPRLNNVYTLDIGKIPVSVIRTIEKDVIGYD